MHEETRETIYIGVNFVLAPPPPAFDNRTSLRFQTAALDEGLEVVSAILSDNQIVLLLQNPQLEVQAIRMTDPPLGQLIVRSGIGSNPEMFAHQVAAVIKAYKSTWPARYQLVQSDATVRDLVQSNADHAFQELWEKRLGQKRESLGILGKPILGGGLRLVMPPLEGEEDPAEIDIKIESQLIDSKKLFFETIFRWPQPSDFGNDFDIYARFRSIEDFINNSLVPFAKGEGS